MDVSIEVPPATAPATEPEGRAAVASFRELADALEALWRAQGGERVPVHVERHGTPTPGRCWPR